MAIHSILHPNLAAQGYKPGLDFPLVERSIQELYTWREKATEHLKQRLAGQISGWPLTRFEYESYKKMIDRRVDKQTKILLAPKI